MRHKIYYTILLCALCALGSFRANALTYQLNTTFGNWNDPGSWLPQGVPGPADTAILDVQGGSTLFVNADVTVGTLLIENISQFAGDPSGTNTTTLTILNRLLCKTVPTFSCNLLIAQGATAEFNNDNFSSPFAGIYFYGEVTVNGFLETKVEFINATRINLNGTMTHRKGGLAGDVRINLGATLNLNSPSKRIDLGFVQNQGVLNWQAGDIFCPGNLLNQGLWNISANGDTLDNDYFLEETSIENIGQIRVAASVGNVALLKRIRNAGTIIMDGPSALALTALRNIGTVSGPAGSSLELSGYYFDTGNTLQANSTLNVSTLRSAYLTQLDIQPGVNLGNIQNFELGAGPHTIGTVLPPAANYRIEAQMALETDLVFSGQVLIANGGSFSGPHKVTFSTTNATWENAIFENANTEISAGAQVALTNARASNLLNNGTINWAQSGDLTVGIPGMVNNGTLSITAPKALLYGSWNGGPVENLLNNGTIAYNHAAGAGLWQALNCGLRNEGDISIGAGDTLRWIGELQQKERLVGSAGSQLEIYGSSGATFANGAETANFQRFYSNFSSGLRFEAGTVLNNIAAFRFENSQLESRIVLPPAADYTFQGSILRLFTAFQPTTPLLFRNSSVEGSGSVRITGLLDWQGGTFDVPLRIEEGASASIRETDDQRPIISAPFNNLGTVTLSGGIIEINTGFFKNKGTWQVQSTDDVIIDGFTPFVNDGILAICGNQPIQINFNVPFTNEENGTFKGEGTYTFNADYTNNGTVAPGCSPGLLEIDGNFQTGAGMEIEIESEAAGMHDFFRIRGDLQLGGVLRVLVPDGAAPAGPIKVIETEGQINGSFSTVLMPPGYTLSYTDQAVFVNATGAVSTQAPTPGSGWQLRPSLASDWLRVELDEPSPADLFLQIWDAQGKQVQTALLPTGASALDLLIQTLQPGAYTLLHSGGGVARFVKMP
jgi:hypothetical protein